MLIFNDVSWIEWVGWECWCRVI